MSTESVFICVYILYIIYVCVVCIYRLVFIGEMVQLWCGLQVDAECGIFAYIYSGVGVVCVCVCVCE